MEIDSSIKQRQSRTLCFVLGCRCFYYCGQYIPEKKDGVDFFIAV